MPIHESTFRNRKCRMTANLTLVVSLAVACGCKPNTESDSLTASANATVAPVVRVKRTIEQRLGTRWSEQASQWSRAPVLETVELPLVPDSSAIWGATGRDDAGNIYLGISCEGFNQPSAALAMLKPGELKATSLGNAVANLRRLGLADDSTTQMKIHGKPVQADDGILYFVSSDENGETDDGKVLPPCGSHLWRMRPETKVWEHLLAAPEGLIATACTGRFVYAVGYFQHVVIQYDTETGAIRKTKVGSVGGHVSRNFMVDLNEHAYVPRVTGSIDEGLEVALIELDENLNEVMAHRLEDYGPGVNFDSHGLVGFAALADGDFIFTTAKGALYRLHPDVDQPSTLSRLGWIHPEGESYPAFLVCPDGDQSICAIAQRPGMLKYEWLAYDIQNRTSKILDLDETSNALLQRQNTLVYGSNTLDDEGHAFIVGWFVGNDWVEPYALRVIWPAGTQ